MYDAFRRLLPFRTPIRFVDWGCASKRAQVHALHAELLTSLGCTQDALAIYLRMDMPEQAVECYRSLNKLDRAETLIRERIVELSAADGRRRVRDDLALFHCLLGDITDNAEHSYELAWQV